MISSGSLVAAEHVGVGHARHRDGARTTRAGRCRWARHPIRRAFRRPAGSRCRMPSSISTLRCVGLPSSSMLSEPRRSAMRAVVDDGDARRGDALADAAAEGRRALAVEVALEAVADRLVQQHAGPARAEHHGHRPGGRGPRLEVHQRLAHRVARELLEQRVGEVARSRSARRRPGGPARAGRPARRSP